ncbi:MAG: adenylosuccinate synthase [Proteobacteria bacterium]|nr:adenylosuccinate synthase [Pseudomonadota bacterium]
MANIILVGSQWGDEGKGKVVDIYTEFADVVIRFQGGGNAGHTIVIGDQQIILHQIPSGICHPDKLCIIGNGMVLDLETLVEEIELLRKNGYFFDDSQLLISEEVHLVMPYHRLLDVGKEKKAGDKKIGTTGRGIGPAYADKINRTGIRFIDLFDENVFREKLEINLAEKNPYLANQLDQPECNGNELFEKFTALGENLKPHLTNTSVTINRLIQEGKNILFEGAQGALLDIDHGTYPYVTSSSTTAGAACTGCGIGPTKIDGVVGIVKAYSTRVGEGPFPTEQHNEIGERLQEHGKEFGATTGRPRRCGWIDTVVLRHAVRVNGLTSLALTKLDVLSGMEKIKICRAYRIDGCEVAEFPANIQKVADSAPVYEEVEGWNQDISAVRRNEDLPSAAKNYINVLQELLGVEFILISVGAKRDGTILLKNPFTLERI